MNAVLAAPEPRIAELVPGHDLLIDQLRYESSSTQTPRASGRIESMLGAAILVTLIAGAVALVSLGLNPAAFVGLLMVLPALAPFILVALAVVFTEDLQRIKERQTAAVELPCSCHQDRLQRALQRG